MKQFEFTHQSGETLRLDKLLLAQLPQVWDGTPTRSQIKLLIESGKVLLNSVVVTKAGALVRPATIVTVTLPEPENLNIEPLEFSLRVLFEDKELIVIDKPAGLSMHPGAGNRSRTLVNALVHHFGEARPELFVSGIRPGIVHRLDRDTTGVIVVAKTVSAHAILAKQFASRTVGREYYALVLSLPRGLRAINTAEEGVIEGNIGRDPHERKRMAVVSSGGKPARTRWRVIERFPHACLLAVRLETGRTHQIRVHMTQLGAPLIGDQTYGDLSALPPVLRIASEKFARQALHAHTLEFTHPSSNERMHFESPLPEDFTRLIAAFRNEGGKP
ncbi:MAG: RluA family pseudouridine synthase [Deltaproteobacteria bacterium]|nr:RluA family pseudouridine synthase [Deltaproteobacteria bacterium]